MQSTDDVSAKLDKPVLKEGSTGDAVEELQELLKKYNTYTGAIDGAFGPLTKKGVIAFQHRVFLKEDGIVADNTWRALFKGAPVDMPILKKGSKGDLVETVQNILKSSKDYNGAIDGEFGSKLERAVKKLQERTELPHDGIVEDRTWFELSKIPH
ncbi:peptidoglycan-binding protein [Hassallia byssoidea VB512170]|uniref:Peptidoglycan-binding protein n=1 Tax=Hassallia byssoidea VB512170 TaxID=1304833 RepID=A0A846HA49_9CYAN|nr:peptidoglycan-binding protein [Hassalia byssoidea]NEU73828.1 peptidoglycan-binding protein [Hassalia byssoidea VB512170]